MESASALLNDPQYFYCERTRCTLKRAVCVLRQKASRIKGFRDGRPGFTPCEDCGQGRLVREEYERPSPRPSPTGGCR